MHTLEEVNGLISKNTVSGEKNQRLSPELGNVCFASAQHGWSFTLLSFAELYIRRHRGPCGFSAVDLSKRLWGDWYVNEQTNAITKKKTSSSSSSSPRTFVQFILEPLYKIYAHILGESPEELSIIFQQLNIKMNKTEIHLDPKPLLKLSLKRFFGLPAGFVTMLAQHIPSPVENAIRKVSTEYTGFQTSSVGQAMRQCRNDSSAPLMANVVKLYNTADGQSFVALARIYSGTIRVGNKVRVLGEAYTQDDDEDMAFAEVTAINVSLGRFSIEVSSATPGNLVLLAGVDHSIKKTATIVDAMIQDDTLSIFRPLKFDTASVMKLAVEPLIPSELPKMVEALRRINKSYPLVTTKVEESGEHIILGTGELYLDCIMHDLRHLYSDIEVKVSDPVACFQETCVESSIVNCFAETPNKKNRLTMLAEPLDNGLSNDIEAGHIPIKSWDSKTIGEFFKTKYDWDLLTARSVWAFGPDDFSPNILLNNTIPSEVNQGLLNSIRESVSQGFKWGTREGPLCDEPIRNVKFRVLDASIANEPIHRGGGQIIPTARRTVYSSMLLATPRIMEPMYLVEMQAPADCIQAIYPVLARRRGHVVHDAPKPGAPFYTVKAYLPVMDSFGFETDLRSYTLGQVFSQQIFDHWAVVPGDPLDKDVILHPLEPSPPLALARDFMVKTRRRKGLNEVSYFNDFACQNNQLILLNKRMCM